jgi:hypothetical protein
MIIGLKQFNNEYNISEEYMVNMEQLEKVIRDMVNESKKDNDYILIFPDARIYRGNINHMFNVVSKEVLNDMGMTSIQMTMK